MGRRVWFGAIALVLGFGCGDDGGPSDASLVCASDDQCDDGVFCNGAESCDPGAVAANALGCVAAEPACLAGQACDEVSDSCETLCEATSDADGDGVDALECGGDDCDDSDSNRYPGNPEICDTAGVDEDCDMTTLGDRDVDGDGAISVECCNGDTCGTDCADGMAGVNPGASEVCDLIDQDCDGSVDEGVQTAGFEDRDGDRHGDPERARMACAFDGDVSPSMMDCADDDGRRHGQMVEICDGQDNDCDDAIDEARFTVSWYADTDGDGFGDPNGEVRASCEPIEGFSTLPFDCDDTDGTRSPISPELCNARDDDCDGRADYQLEIGDTEDDDGDGVADARCPGGAGMDCDDRDPFVRPGVPELCDGVDNDCDGAIDEGATEVEWYLDADGDGFGDPSADRRASCSRVDERVLEAGDCDDGDGAVKPGAPERCNGVDDDCDGDTDENAAFVATYVDADGDGFGTGMPLAQCAVEGLRALLPGDCDDGDPSRRPGGAELCDRADNDCDGMVDEGVGTATITTYADADGDGFGDDGTAITAVAGCDPVDVRGRTTIGGDCDDASASRFPRAAELCDGVDQDCDGAIDEEGGDVLQYPDTDGDGFGDGTPVASCDPLAGHALRPGDCDDGSATSRPGATEECNGVDDDCDGVTDEAPAGTVGCVVDSTNATPVCTDGVCGYGECLSGYGDCDGSSANGCESDLAIDADHCGGCGMGCGLGDTCTASSCDLGPVDDIAVHSVGGCALRGGQVFCWGPDTFGLLGDGPLFTGPQTVPGRPVSGIDDAIALASGNRHVCALRTGGSVWCWGRGVDGELGNGTADSPAPLEVTGGHSFVALSAGSSGTCGRKASGEVWCWGENDVWGLSATPVALVDGSDVPLDDVVDVGVGGSHVCVLRAGGLVWCAGYAATGNGILGYPATGNVPRFTTAVVGLDEVAELGVGVGHSCARRMDGSVWCWGLNGAGQLGDGTTTGRTMAAPASAITDATALFGGFAITCAVRADDTVWCWGTNVRGSMGDSTFADANSPVPRAIPGLTDVSRVAPRQAFFGNDEGPSCVLEAGSQVWCWGGGNGERGTGGSPPTEPAPVVGFP